MTPEDRLGHARVLVEMARNDVFPWMRAPRFEAWLTHRPDGPGDVFRFAVPGVGDVAVNGNASEFIGFWPWRADWNMIPGVLAEGFPR